MIKCKINGIQHEINDGFILKDKYSEVLDSGVITIPFSDKLDLSPFDFVEIEDDRFGKRCFLIDTWTEDVVSFSPLKYNYNISLISETIKLQKVVMPNLAITQRLDSYKKDIWDVLGKYNDMYVYPQYPELSFDENFRQFTYKVDCPESLFNRPTAFEVYNTLLAKKNAVVKVNDNKIGYIRLDKYGKKIDESKLYYVTDTQSIEDYANRLDTQVNNGISGINNVSSITGITVRGGETDSVLSDDNMSIVLDKPIYDLNKIYVSFVVEDDSGAQNLMEFDITDYVVEKNVYDTYLASNSGSTITDKNYKRNALYYVRGSNTIEGLSYSEKYLVVGTSYVAIYNILMSLCIKLGGDANYLLPDFDESEVKNSVSFRIEYKTSESYRMNVVKDNKYNATLIDNQTETQVDSNNFGKVEQDKLNRLGNKAKIITGTYYKDEIIPELGDYIDNYILAEREIIYYDDYALFKGYLYKDYVRKNMFYGLNSKKRSTQIETESVVRNDVVNYDLYFDLEKQQDLENFEDLKRYVLSPIILSNSVLVKSVYSKGEYEEFPKYAFIKIKGSGGYDIVPNYGYILLTPSTYYSGKSNIIHFQFKDNFSAGMRLTDGVSISGSSTGGRKQEYVKYVDNYGEFKGIETFFYSNKMGSYRVDRITANDLPLLSIESANVISQNSNRLFSTGYLELWKDNREITAISVNLNYRDSENVIIGTFAENTGIAFHDVIRENIAICYSEDYEYEKGDQYGFGNIVEDGTVTIDSTNADSWIDSQIHNTWFSHDEHEVDNIKLNLKNIDTSNWKSWAIIDKETNELILGVNKGKENSIPTKIYLKCNKKAY